MNRIAGRSFMVVILVLALIAGMVFFVAEFATQAENWVMFPGSPHVYEGGRMENGVITDRTGETILDLSGDKSYHTSEDYRIALLHWTGDRDGNISTPALEEYPLEMTGFDLLDGVYNYADASCVVEMTLSAEIQAAAMEALGDRPGTVAVYNYKTGEILCAVSSPSFDPLDPPVITEETQGLDGVYVNRFTQSTYIPGSIFKIITVAAALEQIPDIENETFICYGTYEYGIDLVTCEGAHYEQDLKTALANSCNCALAQVADRLGGETLSRYAQKYQIIQPITFDGITTAEGNFNLDNAEAVEVAWAGIGQYTDEINPARFLTFMGTIASGGQGVEPYIVSNIRIGEDVSYRAEAVETDRIMSTDTANILAEYLRNNVQTVYGDWNFPDLSVCAKSGTGEVGGDRKPNATFAGFVQDEQYPLAFIVVVEDGGYGSEVCVPILSEVLAACKSALDQE